MSQAPAGTGPTLRAGEGHARKGRPLHARYTPATHSLYVWPVKHPLHAHAHAHVHAHVTCVV